MSIYTVGSRPAFANATFLSGMIVNWDYDLTRIGDYQLTLKTNPGNLNRSITLRGIDFGGSTYEPDKVCIVGACPGWWHFHFLVPGLKPTITRHCYHHV